MGKGDKKTRKGKIAIGSYGKRRPKQGNRTNPTPAATSKASKKPVTKKPKPKAKEKSEA